MDDERRQNRQALPASVNAFDEEKLRFFIGATMNHLQNLWFDIAGPQGGLNIRQPVGNMNHAIAAVILHGVFRRIEDIV